MSTAKSSASPLRDYYELVYKRTDEIEKALNAEGKGSPWFRASTLIRSWGEDPCLKSLCDDAIADLKRISRETLGGKLEELSSQFEALIAFAVNAKFRPNEMADYPIQFALVMHGLKTIGVAALKFAPSATAKKTTRSASPKRKNQTRRLTERERCTVEAVGHHKGNITAAANELGCSRQTASKTYQRALKKLGQLPMHLSGPAPRSRPKTQSLPTDHRGQEMVANPK